MTASTNKKNPSSRKYSCNEYREEMILLALRQRLQNPELSSEEKEIISKEIAEFEEIIGF